MNNNEKILHIIDSYESIIPKLRSYLKELEQSYDYMNLQRANHMELMNSLHEFQRKMKKIQSEQKTLTGLYELAIKETTRVLNKTEDSTIVQLLEKLLSDLRKLKYDQDIGEEIKSKLGKNYALGFVLEQLVEADTPMISEDDFRNANEYVVYYTQSFKEYQSMDKEELSKNLRVLASWAEGIGLDVSDIELVIWMIEDDLREKPKKPDPSELLDELSGIRTPTAYIKRGYTILKYYQSYISAMNHLRRVLRERNGYQSVKRAIDRYYRAVDDIQKVHSEKYIQGGGNPTDTKETKARIKKLSGTTTRSAVSPP